MSTLHGPATRPMGYISLFSSAGIGCYGLKSRGFTCVASVELHPRRLAVQLANASPSDNSAYRSGDIEDKEVQAWVRSRAAAWKAKVNGPVDVVVATPPCQGISVANHKKKNELPRNSLVVEALKLIDAIRPRFFILENVRSFLNVTCQVGENLMTVANALSHYLSKHYEWEGRVLNLAEYGSPSSRTRTLVIGALKSESRGPGDLFPTPREPSTLRGLTGHLPMLSTMGEISSDDIFHAFRPYQQRMRPWIAATPEGGSAFDNLHPADRPHRIIDGEYVPHVAKNGDKYARASWDRIPPCVHTRNDILASQKTVHPSDDRVFSIREVMLMMGVPETFRWSDEDSPDMHAWPSEKKRAYLKRHEMNIRQCLGEAVPTPVIAEIANNVANARR